MAKRDVSGNDDKRDMTTKADEDVNIFQQFGFPRFHLTQNGMLRSTENLDQPIVREALGLMKIGGPDQIPSDLNSLANDPKRMQRSKISRQDVINTLKLHYQLSTDTLKIALLPTTSEKIYSVEDLHVPADLYHSKISPDIPVAKAISADGIFKKGQGGKLKNLLIGPGGVGKTTEVKMWVQKWCKSLGPLESYQVVLYVDVLQVKPGSTLGEAIVTQCFPVSFRMTPQEAESMCRDTPDDVLLIIDNIDKVKEAVLKSMTSILDLILLQDFQSLTVLAVTSPDKIKLFRPLLSQYNIVKAIGILPESVETYVTQLYASREDSGKFGKILMNYLKERNLIDEIAANPLLLSSLCQEVKWSEDPTEHADLATMSSLVDMLIMHCIKHSKGYTSMVQEKKEMPRRIACGTQGVVPFQSLHNAYGRAAQSEYGSNVLPVPPSTQSEPLSDEALLCQLRSVAFHRYFGEQSGSEDIYYLSQEDFDVCGERKEEVLKKGCDHGLLTRSVIDEIIPPYSAARKGSVITFGISIFQPKFAAAHLCSLLDQGQAEEFRRYLAKVRSSDEAENLRDVLKFTCTSVCAAREIISHVLALSRREQDVPPENKKKDVISQSDGLQQRTLEMVLEFNHEAQSKGKLNDVLRPAVQSMRLSCPSAVTVKSLIYLLQHAAPDDAAHLDDVHIEVFNGPDLIERQLSSVEGIKLLKNSLVVNVEIPKSEERQVGGAADGPPLITYKKFEMQKLTISSVQGTSFAGPLPQEGPRNSQEILSPVHTDDQEDE